MPTRPRKLSRFLALFFGGFGLLSSLALAWWMHAWQQRQSLAAFERLAVINAGFVSQLRLPRSPELARRLAAILDTGVGFSLGGKSREGWPPGLEGEVASMAKAEAPVSRRASGFEIAVAPLDEPGVSLVLMRRTKSPGSGFLAGAVLIPSLSLALACGGLAFALARGIGRPLEQLTGWLPNLDLEREKQPNAIPAPILLRGDEIGCLAQALEQTGRRLREEQGLRRQAERLATLGRIATSLAHEIKNPAAAIALHADLLGQSVSPEQVESVELIREEVERITGLVNQWLFVARARPAQMRPHDLRELILNVYRRLRPALDHAQATFTLEDGVAPARIDADAPRIEQALRNLLVNAAQAMPCGGAITVRVEQTDSQVELSITDQGPGFSAEALRRFGEPFYSGREGGMGLGLTLAREVVQAHGGSIHPSNREGGGACVRCAFPRPATQNKTRAV